MPFREYGSATIHGRVGVSNHTILCTVMSTRGSPSRTRGKMPHVYTRGARIYICMSVKGAYAGEIVCLELSRYGTVDSRYVKDVGGARRAFGVPQEWTLRGRSSWFQLLFQLLSKGCWPIKASSYMNDEIWIHAISERVAHRIAVAFDFDLPDDAAWICTDTEASEDTE